MTYQLPTSIPDEEAVLGAMLVSEGALRRVTVETGLRAEHFYLDRHRAIFAAVQHLAAKIGTADELTVMAELDRRGQIDVAGGKHYVSELAAKVPAASNATHYATRVLETATLRQKAGGAQEVLAGITERDEDKIQSGTLAMTVDLEADSEPSTPEEMASEMWDWLQETPSKGDVLKLPWDDINKLCAGGYRRGQMSLLTGWSGMGKSLVLLQMFKKWREDGHTNLLLTTEMDRREIIARYLAGETRIAYEKIISREGLSTYDWSKINKALAAGIPFHYYDADGWPVERILSAIVNKRPDVAAIDPWNLIPHKDRFAMDETARRLKEIARRANCHVLVVAHLNTLRMKDGKKPRPVQRDIRDSGMLYNNAHRVLCLHRDQNEKGEEKRNGELFLMKSRDGMLGGIEVESRPHALRFDPVGTKEEEEAAREPDLFA